MATKKKASAARSAKVTKPVTKKAIAKKPVAKRTVAKKSGKSLINESGMNSFKAYPGTAEFLSWRITRQTIYWSALLIYVLCLSLWVLKIQTDILEIISQIQ